MCVGVPELGGPAEVGATLVAVGGLPREVEPDLRLVGGRLQGATPERHGGGGVPRLQLEPGPKVQEWRVTRREDEGGIELLQRLLAPPPLEEHRGEPPSVGGLFGDGQRRRQRRHRHLGRLALHRGEAHATVLRPRPLRLHDQDGAVGLRRLREAPLRLLEHAEPVPQRGIAAPEPHRRGELPQRLRVAPTAVPIGEEAAEPRARASLVGGEPAGDARLHLGLGPVAGEEERVGEAPVRFGGARRARDQLAGERERLGGTARSERLIHARCEVDQTGGERGVRPEVHERGGGFELDAVEPFAGAGHRRAVGEACHVGPKERLGMGRIGVGEGEERVAVGLLGLQEPEVGAPGLTGTLQIAEPDAQPGGVQPGLGIPQTDDLQLPPGHERLGGPARFEQGGERLGHVGVARGGPVQRLGRLRPALRFERAPEPEQGGHEPGVLLQHEAVEAAGGGEPPGRLLLLGARVDAAGGRRQRIERIGEGGDSEQEEQRTHAGGPEVRAPPRWPRAPARRRARSRGRPPEGPSRSPAPAGTARR